MSDKKTTSISNDSHQDCVEVLCRYGSKDLNSMSEKKTVSTSNDSHWVMLKFCVGMEAKLIFYCLEGNVVIGKWISSHSYSFSRFSRDEMSVCGRTFSHLLFGEVLRQEYCLKIVFWTSNTDREPTWAHKHIWRTLQSRTLLKGCVEMEAKISTRCQRTRQRRHRMILKSIVLQCWVEMEAKISTRCQRWKTTSASNDSHESFVAVLCRDGSKDLY